MIDWVRKVFWVQITNEVNRTGRRRGKESRKRDRQESMRLQEKEREREHDSEDESRWKKYGWKVNVGGRLWRQRAAADCSSCSLVCDYCHPHPFSLSVSRCVRFPVILSIENHCSIQQQKKIAQHLKEIFGDKLDVEEALNKDPKQIPSPNSLKGKILLKVQREPAPFLLSSVMLFPFLCFWYVPHYSLSYWFLLINKNKFPPAS